MPNSYLRRHTRVIVSLIDLRHRKRAPQCASPLSEPGQNEEEDVISISEEEEPTPWPKRTALKTQFVNDGISELASNDPDWEMSLGDNGEDELEDELEDEVDELDSTDLGTENPLKQKDKAKSSKQKNAGKGKGEVNLRTAILQGRSRIQPEVRRGVTRGVQMTLD